MASTAWFVMGGESVRLGQFITPDDGQAWRRAFQLVDRNENGVFPSGYISWSSKHRHQSVPKQSLQVTALTALVNAAGPVAAMHLLQLAKKTA